MARFVFRAAAALELRQRREEEAQRSRAEAQAAMERAEQAVTDAKGRLADTLQSGRQIIDPTERIWYRNWIARQHQEIARRQAMAADRRIALTAAIARAQIAHRDVRALERLRDRMKAAWDLEERRKEQKELDWLGSVRYALRPDAEKEAL